MPVTLTATVECPQCGASYPGQWASGSDSIQDMAGPPVAVQACPACGHRHEETYPGWTNFTEAG